MTRRRPPCPCCLTALRADVPCGRIVANRWRPDLDRAGLGDGRCAFEATLAGTDARLVLRRCTDGAVLPVAPDAGQ